MRYTEIPEKDYPVFHSLACAYYREGEDAETPQEELDGFIRLLFGMLTQGEIRGCFALEGEEQAGFALWASDTEDFAFSQLPGHGTILEIGLIPRFRRSGRGREFVLHLEECMKKAGLEQFYVCAYGPAQIFWQRLGYSPNGSIAENGLPILTKTI